MWVAAISWGAILLGAAALMTACSGVLSTFLGAKRARNEEQVACEEKLRAVRAEAGTLSEQLYNLRTGRQEGT